MSHSFYDKNEKLYVDCTECERGINGGDKDKCSAGWKHKLPGFGCFCGTIISRITPGDFSEGPDRIVRFKVRKRPKNKNRPSTIKTYKGRIVGIAFGSFIIQGIDIPGLYNRPMNAVDMVGI